MYISIYTYLLAGSVKVLYLPLTKEILNHSILVIHGGLQVQDMAK